MGEHPTVCPMASTLKSGVRPLAPTGLTRRTCITPRAARDTDVHCLSCRGGLPDRGDDPLQCSGALCARTPAAGPRRALTSHRLRTCSASGSPNTRSGVAAFIRLHPTRPVRVVDTSRCGIVSDPFVPPTKWEIPAVRGKTDSPAVRIPAPGRNDRVGHRQRAEHAAGESQQDHRRVLDRMAAQRVALHRLHRRHLAAQVSRRVHVVDQVQ